MWEQLKPTHPTVIIYAQYEDFATIEVEKKMNKNNDISHYVINVNIFDITEQCVDIYKVEDVEKVMKEIRREIEELYDQIPVMTGIDVNNWIDDFVTLLNDF